VVLILPVIFFMRLMPTLGTFNVMDIALLRRVLVQAIVLEVLSLFVPHLNLNDHS